ncbi:MAG: M50 family metallopeptidase [Planctomycetales bacterium]|nr:M50 family metallopeptidase [Planctomycetales bacterium]
MFLIEPTPTQADLHFRLGSIPVRVHPYFWLTSLLLRGMGSPADVLTWIVAVFVSILVHELGHALLQVYFGGRTRIVLYGMGGLAIGERVNYSPVRQVLISLAGPVAGFLFAGLIAVVLMLAGVALRVDFPFVIPAPMSSHQLRVFLFDLFQVNILWGLLNLLPIYPLDGGQVARELFTLGMPPQRGIVASLWVSTITAAGVAVYFFTQQGGGLSLGSLWPVLMFGLLAYSSFQTLQAYQNSRGAR